MKQIAFLFLFAFAFSLGLFSQVVAKFSTIDKTVGCPPLFVHFINESSGSGTLSYKWDFGGGATSTQSSPSKTFSLSGMYSIKLVVTNGVDTDSIIKTDFVNVFYPPLISYLPNDIITSCAPNDVSYTNTSTPGSAQIVEYKWDFGDGYISLEANPKHPYTVSGIYTPAFTVKDANGCLASTSISNQVKVYKPNALFTSSEMVSCEGAIDVKFTNLSNGSGNMKYLWSYGDGTSAAVKDSSHYYKGVGNYSVSLQVTDAMGCSDTIVKPDYVKITAISSSFTTPSDTVCPNTAIQFTNTTIGATVFTWDFGDGVKTSIENPKYTYTSTGSFVVTLAASNGVCGGIASRSIVVESVKASFVPEVRYICQVPKSVKYINKSLNAVKFDWRFGNKSSSTEQEPTVVFDLDEQLNKNKQYNYVDTLTITSARGCKSKMVLDSSVVIILPVANFTPNPIDKTGEMKGCSPLTVNFKDKSSYNSKVDKIIGYKWEFRGDSKPVNTLKEFTEIFTKDTLTQVILNVNTQLGCVGRVSYDFGAGLMQKPDFEITNSSHTLCASEMVMFENKSVDMKKITSILWSWGDGKSTALEDSHVYTKIGPMNVSLEVSSYGCVAKITKANFITINGPIVAFKETSDCKKPYDKTFVSELIGATSYSWNLGDGTIVNNQPNVTHTYVNRGNYPISLNAINAGCSAQAEAFVVKVRAIDMQSTVLAANPCVNSVYLFKSQSSVDASKWYNGSEQATYLWNFGDGTKPVFTNETLLTHKFAKRGNYKITLVSKDENQCVDTLVINQRIYRPYANFTPEYLSGCMPVDFKFSNTSKADTLSSVQSYKWSFGDGATSTIENTTHQYSKWGNYNVSLIANDNQGCSDTIVKSGAVSALYPNPKFSVNDTTLCVGDTAAFASVVPASLASYLWTFPDGTTSTIATPKMKFPLDGNFDVKLYVVDKHGCDTIGIQSNFIKVQKPPIVDFSADPLESNCYPTEVTFTDLTASSYLGSWRWNFGDANGFSYRQNPQHIYIRPGRFDVKLVARTTYGCTDSITKSKFVNPKGPYAEIIANDSICRDASLALTLVNPYNVYSFKWDLGDGTVELDTSIVHTYRNVGFFNPGLFLVSDSAHSCDKFIRDTVYVPETLAKYKLDNSSQGGCVPFQISYTNQSTKSHQWLWQFGNGIQSTAFSPRNNYPVAGEFIGKLSVRSEMGCTDSVTLKPITVFPLPTVSITPDTFICVASRAQLKVSGGVEYVWDSTKYISDLNSSLPIVTPVSTTKYRVLVTDKNGCKQRDSVIVTVVQYPVVQELDSTIIVGESVQLNVRADDIKSYSWLPNTTITCADCPDPVVQPLHTTIYTVTVQDTANCFTKNFSTKISVNEIFSVDVPTAFTPNGDGLNDQVFVKGWGIKELVVFRIFNRFGKLVFETTDINTGWNGEGNGDSETGDTFQYIVKVLTYSETVITKSGTIKIIK